MLEKDGILFGIERNVGEDAQKGYCEALKALGWTELVKQEHFFCKEGKKAGFYCSIYKKGD